ncbi:ribonuclease R [Ihubacter sp. mB4P-1]|uniref:ribonuclease R n=1 Tax=Ihubacter sp. mB4P-1 TaxID=3242370 RepID=UPI00137B5D61
MMRRTNNKKHRYKSHRQFVEGKNGTGEGPFVGVLEKNKAGFGFVRQEEGKDIFIGRSNMAGAMHGDTVQVDLLPEYLWERSKEGIVDKVLIRANQEVVGTFQRNKKFGFVIADDKRNNDDVFVKRSDFRGAQSGDKVVVKITRYPERNVSAEGKITEIISRYGQPGGEIKALIRSGGLYETFPSRCNAEAKARSKELITLDEIIKRRDLRAKNIFTIDGASAKDLDDAVSIEELPNGNYLLGVHIADVSHYVQADGPLDKEALKRGNSVYLLSRVVPMLPKVLSNGICSLNPKVERLTLSCQMEIDRQGTVVGHEIFESVINSKARLVYDDVSDMLEKGDDALIEKYSFIYEDLIKMQELAGILRKKRKERGSLDFDFDEAEILLNENEEPIEIGVQERRTANRIIEEFMLAANQTVAEQFYWMQYPFVYRVHEKPDTEKIGALKAFLAGFGVNLPGNPDNIHPKALSEILEGLAGRPYETIASSVILRSMKKAFYSTECEGHFGLSFRFYCHFTSPIRRYPDLMIHRIIKAWLSGEADEKLLKKFRKDAENASLISSQTERKAQEMEREVIKMKKAQYMEGHIGEVYSGIISGVTAFGIYVQLPNTVEGMVRLDSLKDDFYDYEDGKYRVIGRQTRKIYALGDVVTVLVLAASAEDRQIDFLLLSEESLE